MKSVLEMNEAERRDILFKCRHDLILFGRVFAPRDFLKNQTPEFHYKEAEKVMDETNLSQVKIWPRGYSKTTIFTQLYPLHRMLYQDSNNPEFIILIGEIQDNAKDFLKWIKTRIESEEVRCIWGDLRGDKWRQDDIVTASGARVRARGTGQALRGAKEDHMRPTLIVLDDFESENNTITEESRKNNANWIPSAVLPALDPKVGKIIANCTIIHEDSWMNNIYKAWNKAIKSGKSFSWDVTYYKATHDGQLNDDSIPLWPDRFPLDWLRGKRKALFDAGTPSKFYQEWMNEPISGEDRRFQPSDFRFYEGHHIYDAGVSYVVKATRNKDGKVIGESRVPVEVTIGVDPAISAKTTSDKTIVMAIGTDSDDNIYVIDYFSGRIRANETVDKIFEFNKKYHPDLVVIESTAYQEALVHYVEEEEKKTHEYFTIQPLKPRASKSVRLEAMQPHFHLHKMFMKENQYDLLHELEYYPDAKHDDTLDALYAAWKFRRQHVQVEVKVDNRSEYEKTLAGYLPEKGYYPIENIPAEDRWKVA